MQSYAVRVITVYGQDPVVTVSATAGHDFTPMTLRTGAEIDALIRELQAKKEQLNAAIHQRIGELAALLPKQ